MELKSYQKEVIADLAHYLELVVKLQSPAKAHHNILFVPESLVRKECCGGPWWYAGLCERASRRAPYMRQGAYRRWQDLHRRQFSAHDF